MALAFLEVLEGDDVEIGERERDRERGFEEGDEGGFEEPGVEGGDGVVGAVESE